MTRCSSWPRRTPTRCASRSLLDPSQSVADSLSNRELRLGLKLHHKLCAQACERLQPVIDKYGEDETQAKTDVETIIKALFPKHRLGSKQCVLSTSCTAREEAS